MENTKAIKVDKLDLWCRKYYKNCKDVPIDGRCHKCCKACMESE